MLAGNSQDGYGEGYIYFTKAGTISTTEQPAATGSLTVYPNPANTTAFLSMKNNYTGPVNIVLYNTIGQQVMAVQRTKTNFELKEEVPLTGLASGMYYFSSSMAVIKV
ncbi:T9SS type A sorting domain-containing protein [Paraflavitalea speifideaquila]|uniref:T9SS type A sorting domain-containing protein n=1 Tax=Paraflavitalea speifideaquila TaxID=3076558 RepID=UPI0028E48298|nr:T9SS type A sorting domain-containing protein [Paraflavitalea speifideiaquila]